MYDCLSLYTREHKHLADLNRSGSLHVFGSAEGAAGEHQMRDVWARMVAAEDPKDVVDRVATAMRLPSMKQIPASAPETLVYRMVAAFLSATVLGRTQWRCVNGYADSSDFSCGVLTEFFDRFPSASARLRERSESDVLGQPAYRFWFICRGNDPVLCLEKTGVAWTLTDRVVFLPRLYAEHHRIWPVVWDLMHPHLP